MLESDNISLINMTGGFDSFSVLAKSADGKLGRIEGLCSTDHRDEHGHIVVQEGLVFTDFLKNAHVMYEHFGGALEIVGKPVELEMVDLADGHKGHRLATDVYLENETARKLYDTSMILAEHGEGRALSYSLEGKFKDAWFDKDTNSVEKCLVKSSVITHDPANKNCTYSVLMKSILGGKAAKALWKVTNADRPGEMKTLIKGIAIIREQFPKMSWDDAEKAYFLLMGLISTP